MAKPPADMVIANVECPACHQNVEVRAAFAIKTSGERVTDLFAGVKQLGVQIVIRGVYVSHDCRKDPDANSGRQDSDS